MVKRFAARAVTGPAAFLLGWVIDVLAFAAASARARARARSRWRRRWRRRP